MIEPSQEHKEKEPDLDDAEGVDSTPQGKDADHPQAADPVRQDDGDRSHIEGLSGRDSTAIGIIKDAQVTFENTFVQDFPNLQRHLKASHFDTLNVEETARDSEEILCDRQESQRLFEFLADQRFLVLAGESELGKETLARFLAARLCQAHSLDGLLRHPTSPDRKLRIDLKKLYENELAFKRRVVILKDVFQQKNHDLIQFARNADRTSLKSFRKRLSECDSFLIFTSDTEKIPSGRPEWHSLVLEAEAPSMEVRLAFLEKASLRLIQEESEAELANLLDSQGNHIVEAMNTIPRIDHFIRRWLLRVVSREVSLEVALKRANNLDRWLLEDHADDLEMLSAKLAMAICHAHPDVAGVPWFQFEQMRQHIFRHLRVQLRHQREPLAPETLCREAEILRLLDAEVQASPDGLGDQVRFVKHELAEQLWTTLLGSGRRLLAAVAPLLDRLVNAKEFFLRLSAARALGRIGQIDPYGIVLPRLNRWSRDKDRLERIGPLMQGVLGSEHHEFRYLCERQFRSLIRSDKIAQSRAGILALRAVGSLDLEYAMRELRWIAKERLRPRLEDFDRLYKNTKSLEAEIQRQTRWAELRRAVSSELNKELYKVLGQVFPPNEEFQILAAVQYTLVGLCFELDAHRIIGALNGWMPAGKAGMAPLLSLMLLRDGGLADILEKFPVELPPEEDRVEQWSHFLYWNFSADETMACLRDFLLEIYLGIGNFPILIQRALRWRFKALLKGWARQACKGQFCRPGVIALLSGLLEAPDKQLRDEVFDLLQGDKEFSKHGSRLAKLADEVLISRPPT